MNSNAEASSCVTDSIPPMIVAIDMGYGHLRAAEPLAEVLGTPVFHADRTPIGGRDERAWAQVRRRYERLSRLSQLPGIGPPVRAALEAITSIPHLYPYRSLAAPTMAVRFLHNLIDRGFGTELIEHLRTSGSTLLTTFYTPAIVANHGSFDRIVCVITDTDINRIWVARNPATSRIQYCVPSLRARRRLLSYGVPDDHIEYTGFPLPNELVGDQSLSVLKSNLVKRLARLDPKGLFRSHAPADLEGLYENPAERPLPAAPPLLTFAVGGAGAQSRLARAFLPSLAKLILDKRLRIALVAGVRSQVASDFREAVHEAALDSELGDAIHILFEPNWNSYYRAFNRLLTETDILWTKPSELVFYAALGLPEILAPPIGVHEAYNQRWLIEAGAGIPQGEPRCAGQWLLDWIEDGTLAASAWSAFVRLPKLGTYRIRAKVRACTSAQLPPADHTRQAHSQDTPESPSRATL